MALNKTIPTSEYSFRSRSESYSLPAGTIILIRPEPLFTSPESLFTSIGIRMVGDLAGLAQSYEKGDNLDVVGTLQQRQFTPKDGSQRTVYEVVVQYAYVIAKNRPTATTDEAGSGSPGPSSIGEKEDEVDAWAIL
jgi:hypothetical protein